MYTPVNGSFVGVCRIQEIILDTNTREIILPLSSTHISQPHKCTYISYDFQLQFKCTLIRETLAKYAKGIFYCHCYCSWISSIPPHNNTDLNSIYLSTYLSCYLSDRVRMAVTFFEKPTNITDNNLLLAQPFVDRRVVVAFFYVVRGQELLYSQIKFLAF